MLTSQPDAAIERTLRYHEETKHHLHRYARSLGYLKWEDQPDPFREYQGSPRIELPLAQEGDPRSFADLISSPNRQARALTLRTLGYFFEHSLALSAWKEAPGARWALRINPSSGNLHPTEAYALLPPLPEIGSSPGVYHYLSRDHVLELRSRWPGTSSGGGGFYLALTSILWREAWKYGERAFRYCQHDLGHALAAVALSAAMLGWKAQLRPLPSAYADWLLDLGQPPHPAENEIPEALLWIQTEAALPPFELPEFQTALERFGQPNQLSAGHADWPLIDEVAAATREHANPAAPPSPRRPEWPDPNPVPCSTPASRIIRQRRSAVDFDGATPLSRTAFLQILDGTLPRSQVPPFDLWELPVNVHLVLFVHRVTELGPGLYLWARDLRQIDTLRAALRPEFLWTCEHPEKCPLFELGKGDLRDFAKEVSCHQDIAADGAFSLGMLTRFEPALRAHGAHAYRELFWEAGIVGQSLYLGAEAAGVRGTGIGCYFDDVVHDALGLKDRAWQSLYHFTVGSPVDDPRLRSAPPYGKR